MGNDFFLFSLLSGIAVALLLAAILLPESQDKRAQARLAQVMGKVKDPRKTEAREAELRRRQISDTLNDIEKQERERGAFSIERKIAQAGLFWSPVRFYIFAALSGIVVASLFAFLTGMLLMLLPGLIVGGFLLPLFILDRMKQLRISKFLDEFSNAIDMITRGVRVGLPLADCLRLVASEANEPVKSEFKAIVEAQTLGISLSEACAMLYQRMPVAEANFFAILVQTQTRTGGNLTEILGNLSKMLRDRKRLKNRAQAMSSEAKVSAMIIGAMPFVVGVMVAFTSPAYMGLLWTTSIGRLVLFGSFIWMAVGIYVMRRMISFEI